MKIVFLGPPGSGKGTQSIILCRHFGLAHISTGEMLREEARQDSDLGRRVKEKIDRGQLIDDATIGEMVVDRLQHPDCSQGFILDGIPRTVTQAKYLKEHGIAIDHIVELYCDTEILVRRLSSRRVHPASGRIYNLLFNPPQNEGQDDITGEPLEQRADDQPDAVRQRIQDYATATRDVCTYYFNLARTQPDCHYHRLNAALLAEKLTKQLLSYLKV